MSGWIGGLPKWLPPSWRPVRMIEGLNNTDWRYFDQPLPLLHPSQNPPLCPSWELLCASEVWQRRFWLPFGRSWVGWHKERRWASQSSLFPWSILLLIQKQPTSTKQSSNLIKTKPELSQQPDQKFQFSLHPMSSLRFWSPLPLAPTSATLELEHLWSWQEKLNSL